MDEHCLRTVVVALAFAFAMPIASTKAEIKTQTIDYKQGDATLEGYLAYDDATAARRPGIIVAHEWGGITAYEKMRSEMLARLGFVAFAADIYGKAVRPTSVPDKMAQSGPLLANLYMRNIQTIARFCVPA